MDHEPYESAGTAGARPVTAAGDASSSEPASARAAWYKPKLWLLDFTETGGAMWPGDWEPGNYGGS